MAGSTGSTVLTWPLTITLLSPLAFTPLANVLSPWIAAGPAGAVYITNPTNATVSKVSGGVATIITGTPGVAGSTDGPGGTALFSVPTAIATDAAGNLYVADSGNSTIRKISLAGVVSTLAGLAKATGNADGTGSNARFNDPNGVAVDTLGNVYVSDSDSVRKITPDGTVTTIASNFSSPGEPSGVAVDSTGNVYTLVGGNLFKISPGGITALVAKNLLSGATFFGAGAAGTDSSAATSGLSVDAGGNCYLLLGRTYSNGASGTNSTSLIKISPNDVESTIYVWSAVGVPPAVSSTGTGMAIDPSGNLLVAGSSIFTSPLPFGPQITNQPQSVQVLPGQSASFSVEAVGAPAPLSYQWQFNGSPIAGATAPTLTLPAVTAAQGGSYAVTVSTAFGGVLSAPATLGFGTALSILVQPQSQSVIPGAPVALSVSASPGASYQWLFNGVPIAGQTTSVLTINSVVLNQGGTYSVVVSLGSQLVTSNPALLQVQPLNNGTVFPAPVGPTTVNLGTAVTLTSSDTYTLNSLPPIVVYPALFTSYQWEKNGLPIPGATGYFYTIPATSATDAGIYTVAAANGLVTLQSAGLAVGVNGAPGATFLDSWTASAPLLPATQYSAVAFDGSRFLAAGTDGSLFLSSNAVTWSQISSAPAPLNSLIAAGPPYGLIGVGNNGLVASFSGPTYAATVQTTPTRNLLTGIAVGGGRMVAVGFAGTAISSNFAVPGWVSGFTNMSSNLNSVAYGNGVFVAVGLDGAALTSPDGLLWNPQSVDQNPDLYSVAFGGAGFVAIGGNRDGVAGGVIYTSPDGVIWTYQPAPGNAGLIRVTAANGMFIAVGASGALITSSDGGFTWTPHNSGTTATLEGAAFGLNEFVTVGSGGTVSQSAAAAVRLGNISTRAFVGTGANNLIAGFVTAGSGPKSVLIRGVGPTLTQVSIAEYLPNPQLTLFNGVSAPIATNNGWGNSAALAALFTQVGAFPLLAGSLDDAMAQTLNPGSYTAQVSGTASSTGIALAEIYDADTGVPGSRLVNLSSRAFVGTGANALIAGFVISGNAAETVVIRGVGPGLSQFGLTGLLATPTLTVYDGGGNLVASNSTWGGTVTLANAFTQVGAFSLPVSSSDTALLLSLPPGSYTAEVTGAGNTTGVALVEIYEVQ